MIFVFVLFLMLFILTFLKYWELFVMASIPYLTFSSSDVLLSFIFHFLQSS